jgi:menaquinol-cytochrome c reductase iron-sulfur subunit
VAEEGNDKQGAPESLPEAEPAGYFEGESITRRNAFSISIQAIGGLAGAAIVLPAIGFAAAPLFEQEDQPFQAVGSTADFTPDTYRAVVITAVENIGETGKTTVFVRQGDPGLTGLPSGYEPEKSSEYIAITTRCAHLGCPVNFVQAAGNFICPCHGGVYGFLGERIGGPPVRPLDRFQTRVSNGQVEVGPRYSVTNHFDPVRARDPGEFTGGVWNILYPPRPSVPPPP